MDPLQTSCSCADFVRSSLGLCKHGLTMLEALEELGALARAGAIAPPPRRKPLLCWDFQHPLRDSADRLARVRYQQRDRSAPPSGLRDGRPLPRMLRGRGLLIVPAALKAQWNFVDDLSLEPKWRLVPFHSVYEGDGGKGVTGARNLDVLRARLSESMLRRVRRDVLAQLPARTDTRVPVEMTAAQRERHDDLRRPIAELMSKAARRPLRQAEFLQLMQLLTRQRIVCNGLAQVSLQAEWPTYQASEPTPENLERMFAPKLAALRALIEQVVLGQQRKAVIFSQWRNMLRLAEWAVRDLLRGAGMRAVFFTGAESPKLRERAVVELHDDPNTTVMFLSDAGGVGLNLQRAASCCINLELPWNPAVLEQRIGRIYRLGQTLPIDVYKLVTEEGIEALAGLLEALARSLRVPASAAIAEAAPNGTTEVLPRENGAGHAGHAV